LREEIMEEIKKNKEKEKKEELINGKISMKGKEGNSIEKRKKKEDGRKKIRKEEEEEKEEEEDELSEAVENKNNADNFADNDPFFC
jgi:hypothetical protein